jgi:hypothetical protein
MTDWPTDARPREAQPSIRHERNMNTINEPRMHPGLTKRKYSMKTHRNSLLWLTLAVALAGAFAARALPVSPSFTFQGLLKDNNGVPVNGPHDIRVSLCTEPFDPPPNNSSFGYMVFNCHPVNNGLLTLKIDFGGVLSTMFYNCEARWLEFAVRPCGVTNSFVVITQRLELLPTPYAIESLKACSVEPNGVTTVSLQDGSVTAGKIGSGQVVKSLNGLHDAVNLVAGANVTITPSGNNLQISAAGAGGSGLWSLNGSSAYYNAGNVGIGTANPSKRLEVQGPGDLELGLMSTDVNGRLWTLQSTAGSSLFPDPLAPWEGCFQIIDRTAGASRLSILTSGRVGLGTIEPSRNLEVQGAGDVEIGLRSTEAGGRLWTIQSSGGVLDLLGSFQIIDRTAGAARLAIRHNGYVGLGTPTPFANLEINVPGSSEPINAMFLDVQSFGTAENAAASYFLRCRDVGSGRSQFVLKGDGNVGIGTDLPAAKLEVAEGDILLSAGRTLRSSGRLHIQANEDLYLNPFGGAGTVIVGGGGGPGNLHVVGSASVCSLTIRGGCDLAEPFPMSEREIPKGALVVIDEDNAGKLKLAGQEYDTRVAGIVSGANGVHPGISLHQEGLLEGGQNVALSGRVYALADASNGAIRPGDLLTSSATPGHVMKVTNHARAQGAIVGKAMSALSEGKGMVLVLVSLQ